MKYIIFNYNQVIIFYIKKEKATSFSEKVNVKLCLLQKSIKYIYKYSKNDWKELIIQELAQKLHKIRKYIIFYYIFYSKW